MGRGGLAGCGQPGWKDSEMQNGTTTKGDFISLTVFSRFSPILPKVFSFFFFFFKQVLLSGKVGWETIKDDSCSLCLYVFK